MSASEINSFLKTYYVNSDLYGSPQPIKEQSQGRIECVFYLGSAVTDLDYTVVMPIHNQSQIIGRNLAALTENIRGSREIILILDSCADDSKRVVLDYFSGSDTGFSRVIVIESDVPLFETVCDNIGFRLGVGRWFLEIQADMKMTEPGFNLRLSEPFLRYDNVIAVSGRCCCSLDERKIIGRGGAAIERPVSVLGLSSTTFYVNEVCNRGPLLLDAKKTRAMGYLDETNFYLENSELDMVLRAFDSHGWICGYVPIDFLAPLCDGSTRKPRDALNAYIMNVRKNRCTGGFVATYKTRGTRRPGYNLPL
jgi:GT2 family glycosyltransferase